MKGLVDAGDLTSTENAVVRAALADGWLSAGFYDAHYPREVGHLIELDVLKAQPRLKGLRYVLTDAGLALAGGLPR